MRPTDRETMDLPATLLAGLFIWALGLGVIIWFAYCLVLTGALFYGVYWLIMMAIGS